MKYSLAHGLKTNKIKMTSLAGVAFAVATVLSLNFGGVALAKEVGSGAGGGGGGTTVCSPVSSFTVKGDSRVTDFVAVGTVAVSYSVKPCDKTQTVNVTLQISDYNTGALLQQYDNLPLSAAVTYYVPQVGKLYQAKLVVTDAVTGQIAGTAAQVVFVPVPKP